MHAHRHQHTHTTSSRVEVPIRTLNHPQFVPQRNEVDFIKQRAAGRPQRVRRLKERHLIQSVIATIILWAIADSNVRYYYSTGNTNMLLIFHGLQFIALILYYLLISSDPGYIPIKDPQQKQSSTSDEDVIIESDDQENVTLITKKPQRRTVDLTACIIPPNFCERCKFFKPTRCKHCYLCDRCVMKYDHHCPLIDHCIGINNYNLFVLFVSFQGTVSFWTFCVAINCLFMSGTIYNWMQWGLRIVLFLWMLYHSVVAVMMICFHIYVISTGQTTYEHVVKALGRKHKHLTNPDTRCCCIKAMGRICNVLLCRNTYEYSNGCAMNWIYFITKGAVQKAWIKPEYTNVIGDW